MDITGRRVGHPVGTDGIVYSVVIPVFNEEANIEALVSRVTPVLDEVGEPYEILFVDDGSSDRTPAML